MTEQELNKIAVKINNVECLCDICKNYIKCEKEKCKKYMSGDRGFINGSPVMFKWTCEDFDYGTCPILENTKCNGCIENDFYSFQIDLAKL